MIVPSCRALAPVVAVVLAFFAPPPTGARAAIVTLPATDAGFVTEMGGSSKGDGSVVPSATYNYSVGFEVHYGTGALGAPLAPMFRKNYFVFDLTAVTDPITAAKVKLWTGTLETADVGEFYELHEITDMPGAVGLATALTTGTGPGDFDSPADPLVLAAKTLYTKLADGPLILGSVGLTPAMNDSFVEIALSPGAIGYLNGFLGEKIVLSGVVPTAVPPPFPQQPFGFTGPDIPGGDPKSPVLEITTIPEPGTGAMAGPLAAGLVAWRWPRRPAGRHGHP